MQTTQAVVKVPFGSHPTSCYPNYTFDAGHIQEYLKMDFEDYKKKYIDLKSHAEYLEKAGGAQMILNILL
jgi:glutaconate CoA-transferase subunit A